MLMYSFGVVLIIFEKYGKTKSIDNGDKFLKTTET